MMLKTVTAGVLVGITPEVWKYEERGLARIFWFALDGVPEFRREAVRPPDSFDV